MKTRTLLVGWLLAAALGACSAGAQVVRQDVRGGELVTWGPMVAASGKAREQMVRHCAGRYTVTLEAEQDHTRRVVYACDRELAMLRASVDEGLATAVPSGAPEAQ